MRCLLICVLLFMIACRTSQPEIEAVTTVPATNTAEATITPSATNTPVPTQTFTPAPTMTPPATLTLVPSHTPTATPSSPLSADVDRTCPDPPPVKPNYERDVLSPAPWPTPDTAVAQRHLWLMDPVAAGRKGLDNGYYPYGWDGGGRFLLHNGSDFPQARGTDVTAVADGTVMVAQSDADTLFGWRCNWYGQLVVLELAERWQEKPVYVLYGHVQQIQVDPGQSVEMGEVLAEIGVEGVSTVPHLHLEIRIGNNGFENTVNPMLWLAPLAEKGVLVGRLVDADGRPWQGIRITLIDSSDEEARFLNTFTYLDDPQHLINPDVSLSENFVFADLEPGFYTLFAEVQGREYRQRVEIQSGEITTVTVVTNSSAEIEE